MIVGYEVLSAYVSTHYAYKNVCLFVYVYVCMYSIYVCMYSMYVCMYVHI